MKNKKLTLLLLGITCVLTAALISYAVYSNFAAKDKDTETDISGTTNKKEKITGTMSETQTKKQDLTPDFDVERMTREAAAGVVGSGIDYRTKGLSDE